MPTDDDLQQYTHGFFASPDIWDTLVLDHGITPAVFDEIHQEAGDFLLTDSMLDEFGDLYQQVVQHLDVFREASPPETGDHKFDAHLNQTHTTEVNQTSIMHYFGWQDEQVIQKYIQGDLKVWRYYPST